MTSYARDNAKVATQSRAVFSPSLHIYGAMHASRYEQIRNARSAAIDSLDRVEISSATAASACTESVDGLGKCSPVSATPLARAPVFVRSASESKVLNERRSPSQLSVLSVRPSVFRIRLVHYLRSRSFSSNVNSAH